MTIPRITQDYEEPYLNTLSLDTPREKFQYSCLAPAVEMGYDALDCDFDNFENGEDEIEKSISIKASGSKLVMDLIPIVPFFEFRANVKPER